MTRDEILAGNEKWKKDVVLPAFGLLDQIIRSTSTSFREIGYITSLRQEVLTTIMGGNYYDARERMTASESLDLVKKYVEVYKRVQSDYPGLSQGRALEFMGGYKWREDAPDAYAEAKVRLARVFDASQPTYEEQKEEARLNQLANQQAALERAKKGITSMPVKQPQSPVTPEQVEHAFDETPHPDADDSPANFEMSAPPAPVAPKWYDAPGELTEANKKIVKWASDKRGWGESDTMKVVNLAVKDDYATAKDYGTAVCNEIVRRDNERNTPPDESKPQEPVKETPKKIEASQQKASAPTPPKRAQKEEPAVIDADTGEILDMMVYSPVQNAVTNVRNSVRILDAMRSTDHPILVEGLDYGVIPGTGTKPTLLKPGAEKLIKAFGYCPEFEVMGQQTDWNRPLFYFQYRCKLVDIQTGHVVATGIGSCNSMESKYRWRESKPACPTCGKELRVSKKGKEEYYCWNNPAKGASGCGGTFALNDARIKPGGKVENDDIFSIVNTLDKMAQKRALIAAVLIGCNASRDFTQDVEDMDLS